MQSDCCGLSQVLIEYRARCNQFGDSKVRILAQEDFDVIFGTDDGPVVQLYSVAMSLAAALNQHNDAPVCYLAACIEQYMTGDEVAIFAQYLQGLAARQVINYYGSQ